tara:strand:+ start:106 stop:492 length:387 start_codon:yes stop_codon:yes gene_type:complete
MAITLDGNGTVTADTVVLTAGTVTGSTTNGAVGTYAWATFENSDTAAAQMVFGTTYAGSLLFPAGFASSSATVSSTGASHARYGSGSAIGMKDGTVTAFSGTWRCMGQTPPVASNYDEMPVTLFVRIS